MLSVLPAYQEAVIVRTRDPAKLERCQIVVDVGAVYDAKALRFDHHQRGFTHTLVVEGDDGDASTITYKTKLSSAGLIYQHFGQDVIREIVNKSGVVSVPNKKALTKIYHKVCIVYTALI